MAKTFKPKNDGAVVLEESTVAESVEETASDTIEEVTEQEVEQIPAVKMVKICPNTDHSCFIGGVRYFLKKGVQQNVPLEVKTILNKSGLLMPL